MSAWSSSFSRWVTTTIALPSSVAADAMANAWADRLRQTVLELAAEHPSSASEAVIRVALGEDTWESLPVELRDHFRLASPAVLAEMRGHGLDLSAQPLTLSLDALAAIRQPTLLVSASDSPEACAA